MSDVLRKWGERPQGQCSDRENRVMEKTVMGGTKTKRTVIKEKEIRRRAGEQRRLEQSQGSEK